MAGRFRFSLRTMFVLLSAVAVWLGWNVHTVNQRKQLLRALRERDIVLPPIEVFAKNAPPLPRVSLIRSWLGDAPQGLIIYTPGPDLDVMKGAFPEAYVETRPADPPPAG